MNRIRRTDVALSSSMLFLWVSFSLHLDGNFSFSLQAISWCCHLSRLRSNYHSREIRSSSETSLTNANNIKYFCFKQMNDIVMTETLTADRNDPQTNNSHACTKYTNHCFSVFLRTIHDYITCILHISSYLHN